jgi:hypothetical protein
MFLWIEKWCKSHILLPRYMFQGRNQYFTYYYYFLIFEISILHVVCTCLSVVSICAVEEKKIGFVRLYPHEQFFSYLVAVTITGDRAANLDLRLALMAFSSEGSFYVPHLLRHGTLVYTVSSKRPASTSHSGIRTRDARIIKSLCRLLEVYTFQGCKFSKVYTFKSHMQTKLALVY